MAPRISGDADSDGDGIKDAADDDDDNDGLLDTGILHTQLVVRPRSPIVRLDLTQTNKLPIVNFSQSVKNSNVWSATFCC